MCSAMELVLRLCVIILNERGMYECMHVRVQTDHVKTPHARMTAADRRFMHTQAVASHIT